MKMNFQKEYIYKKERFERGLNSRPSACKADVITATPSNRWYLMTGEDMGVDQGFFINEIEQDPFKPHYSLTKRYF